MHSYAYHHLFYDGNKRTAVMAVGRFLSANGYRFDYDAARDYDFILEIAKGNRDIESIRAWLEGHAAAMDG
jgi:death-on-curing protein